jgi:hypothetical protein
MTARPGRGGAATTGPTADDGMVTAELAVAIPTLVMVLLAAVAVLTAVTSQLRCTDAAATAARLLARGDSIAVARSTALVEAPRGAEVQVATADGFVTVTVHAPTAVPALGRLLHLPGVSARFSAPLEPGALG